MPVPGDFQLTSAQKGILKQALHYKRAWETEEKTAFDTAFKMTLENANRDVANMILQSQEKQGVELPSLSSSSAAVMQSRGDGGEGVSSSNLASRVRGGVGGLSHVPSVAPSQSSTSKRQPGQSSGTHNDRVFPLLPPQPPGKRGSRHHLQSSSDTRSQLSHHAVSSVLCRDASDVTAASSRVRELETQLKSEEAKRIQVHKELQEIKALIEMKLSTAQQQQHQPRHRSLALSQDKKQVRVVVDSNNYNNVRSSTPATKQISLRALSNGRCTVDLRSKVKIGGKGVEAAPYAYRLQ